MNDSEFVNSATSLCYQKNDNSHIIHGLAGASRISIQKVRDLPT